MVHSHLAHVMKRMAGFDTHGYLPPPRYQQLPAQAPRGATLGQSRRLVQRLCLQQSDLLGESLDCIERGLYRAAHVTAWQAFIDLTSEALVTDRVTEMRRLRPALSQYTEAEQLRDRLPEYELLTVAKEVGLLTMAATKNAYELLSKRNECAHPSSYRPGPNEALGYVSELIGRMADLQNRRSPAP
ncbi:MAG: hypothetical protein H0U40_14070 [Chloroflexia bacterium]|nr:hypothetical protein [Chloroflexia bacterium]